MFASFASLNSLLCSWYLVASLARYSSTVSPSTLRRPPTKRREWEGFAARLTPRPFSLPPYVNGCFIPNIYVPRKSESGRQVPDTAADRSHSDRKLTNSIWSALSQEGSPVAHVVATWAFDKRMLSQV